MISIQTNVNSLVAQQNLSVTSAFQSKTIQQLTSGYRINSAGDDAAGLAVANKFRSSVAELTQGVANGNDAVAQLQIMDGGMSNISQILDRLKTLATQSASGTFTGNRATLNSEFQTDLSEIDRQAQSIGLDTGGTFAKSLSVYLGQGSGSGDGNGGAQALGNAGVVVDLSHSTVDSGSLGLKGLKAIAGTVDQNGTDIGTGSSNGTTVQDIVAARSGNGQAKAGYATFSFAGPGFSDSSAVSVAANLSGVSDANTLATAINTAIANAAGGATQAAQAMKSAGIVASVNTDQYGHQQLAFSSSTTAFQVQAGDQMANALMGNFQSAGSATGKVVSSTVLGGPAANPNSGFTESNVSVQISGAGLGAPVTVKLLSADQTVGAATSDLINQVTTSKALQDAGISVSLTPGNQLKFTSATGAAFNVTATGDTSNALGLGTFVTNSTLNGAASYSDITAGTSYATADTGNGVATLAFSLDGGVTGGITAATVTGAASAAGYNGVGTVGNAAGALGTMTLTLNGSTTPVTVDFSKDANQSATETVQQAANFINSQIQSQAGYGSDVKLATVDSNTNTIKLTGPADGAGTIVAAGQGATALGLTAALATTVGASGSAGNTVSVNLAGGDAKGAVATGFTAAAANIATGTSAVMNMNIDGTVVNAQFANDVNAAGKAAEVTSGKLAADASSTLDISSLQGGKATVSSGVLGGAGVNTTVNISGNYSPVVAKIDSSTAILKTPGGAVASANTDLLTLNGYGAKVATFAGTSLGDGTVQNVSLASLNLSQYKATKAQAIGSALGTGTDANSAIDVSQFAAKAASNKGTVVVGSADGTSAVDYSAYAATASTMSSTAPVAANTTDSIAGVVALDSTLNGANDKLIINGTAINLDSATSLSSVVTAIGVNVAGVTATATADGKLVLTNNTAGATAISVEANNASLALGLSTAGQIAPTTATGNADTKLTLSFDGKANVDIDLSTLGNGSTLQQAVNLINNTVKAVAGVYDGNAGADYGSVASITTDGHLQLTSHQTGVSAGTSGGTVHVVDNTLAQSLGLTTGAGNIDSGGTDAQKLKLNLDGFGERDIDISSAKTVGEVATLINTQLNLAVVTGAGASGGGYGVGAGYATAASGAAGNLVLTSNLTGTAGKVDVVDDAVAQALHLTKGTGDINNQGNAAKTLNLKIDGQKELDIDVSGALDMTTNGATGLVKIVGDAIKAAGGYGGGYTGVVSATNGATGKGALQIVSINTGETGASAGSVEIMDNEISRALNLTAGTGALTQKGTDATTLNVQMDGHAELKIDLSSFDGTAGKDVAALKTFLNTAISTGVGVVGGANYGAPYNAAVDDANAGKLSMKGVGAGGSLWIEDNALAQQLGLSNGVKDTVVSAADHTLNLQIDGNQQVNIDLSSLGTAAKLSDIATAINNALVANTAKGYGTAYANVATANANGSITLNGVKGGGTLTVVNSGLSTYLSLTSSTNNASNTGATPETLNLSFDGKTAAQIDFSGITGGGTPKLSDIADAINTSLKNSATYGDSYKSVATANADGTITISGGAKGSAGPGMTLANNVAAQALGLTVGSAPSLTKKGQDESAADVASFLNSQAQQALGTSTDAKIVSLDASGKISIASQTKGAASSVSIVSAGTTAGLASALNLTTDHAATGSARSAQSVADALKLAFTGNTALQQAGLTALVNPGTQSLEIKSNNGTQFSLDAWGTQNGSSKADLGFGATGQAFTQANTTTSTSSVVDTQGASAIGTFANVKNSASITFQNMQFGNDDQSITISASNAAGVAQTPLTITLQNDETAKTGANIDSAISAINTKLQQSENATMRSITAVRETSPTGVESINLISSLASFNVSVSASGGSAGDGLNGGMANTFSSATNGASSSIAIDTQAGAQQAVTALGAAIATLGSAQATIGRGQNQLTYAISLAASQITNFSAAESQIRDTNVAQQAANLSKAQTLSQAAIAAMAQANSAPQAVLSLLRG